MVNNKGIDAGLEKIDAVQMRFPYLCLIPLFTIGYGEALVLGQIVMIPRCEVKAPSNGWK
jgi:hypothetical protein